MLFIWQKNKKNFKEANLRLAFIKINTLFARLLYKQGYFLDKTFYQNLKPNVNETRVVFVFNVPG